MEVAVQEKVDILCETLALAENDDCDIYRAYQCLTLDVIAKVCHTCGSHVL